MLVYGDTNSTLAGALAGGAGRRPRRPRRGRHALVRPRDARGAQPRPRPTTPATCCCARRRPPSTNLRAEARRGRVEVVGDVMVDVALRLQPRRAERADVLERYGVEPGEYVLVTAHRAGNVDDPARLRAARRAADALPRAGGPPAAPAHRARGSTRRTAASRCERPRHALTAAARICRVQRAALQRPRRPDRLRRPAEGGVPCRHSCVTLRASTEWVETVEDGWNYSSTSIATPRSRRSSARRRRTAHRSTATGARESASSARLHSAVQHECATSPA